MTFATRPLVVIVVELHAPRGYGPARMSIIPDATAKTLRRFLAATVEPGSTVVTDGWAAYRNACRDQYVHGPHPVAGSSQDASLCKRWLLGTHQGRVDVDQLQAYLEEFCFRFNRWPLSRPRLVVLPAAPVRGRHTSADLPAARGQSAT